MEVCALQVLLLILLLIHAVLVFIHEIASGSTYMLPRKYQIKSRIYQNLVFTFRKKKKYICSFIINGSKEPFTVENFLPSSQLHMHVLI